MCSRCKRTLTKFLSHFGNRYRICILTHRNTIIIVIIITTQKYGQNVDKTDNILSGQHSNGVVFFSKEHTYYNRLLSVLGPEDAPLPIRCYQNDLAAIFTELDRAETNRSYSDELSSNLNKQNKPTGIQST